MSVRCKILKGRKKFSVHVYPVDRAEELQREGMVDILDEPEELQEVKEESKTCKGFTSSGDSCSKKPLKNNEYCRWHGPEEAEEG